MPCSVARGLELVGEWWSILIIRNAFIGLSKFDEIQNTLGISPNILSRRLNALVEAQLLEKREYCPKPPRFEYILTDRGRDFLPVIAALAAWGNKHCSPNGIDTVMMNKKSSQVWEPIVVDRSTQEPLTWKNTTIGAGPSANSKKREWLASYNKNTVKE